MWTRVWVLSIALLAQQLPAPFATPWFRKATRVVPLPDGHRLIVPAGFSVNVFADGLQFPRMMALAPNGDVFLAEPVRRTGRDHDPARRGSRRRGRDARDIRCRAEPAVRPRVLAERFSTSATTIRSCGSPTAPVRRAPTAPPEKIVDLPASDAALDQDTANRLKIDISQTRGYNHWTRNVIFSPDGTKHVRDRRVSDQRDAGNATGGRAAINEFNRPTAAAIACSRADCAIRSGWRTFPGTDDAVDRGQRARSTRRRSRARLHHLGSRRRVLRVAVLVSRQPSRSDRRRRSVRISWRAPSRPTCLLPSHCGRARVCCSTPAAQFPAEAYRNSAFVALHGSINRSKLSGYSVVRVPFRDGRPYRSAGTVSHRLRRARRRREAGVGTAGRLAAAAGRRAARVGRRRKPRMAGRLPGRTVDPINYTIASPPVSQKRTRVPACLLQKNT